jgi:hypothetical protein
MGGVGLAVGFCAGLQRIVIPPLVRESLFLNLSSRSWVLLKGVNNS